MPEMRFQLLWPDGSETLCYSPSLVVAEHLAEGACYGVADFLGRVGTALRIASDRVQQKYGMPCARALLQLAQINARAEAFASLEHATVTVVRFLR